MHWFEAEKSTDMKKLQLIKMDYPTATTENPGLWLAVMCLIPLCIKQPHKLYPQNCRMYEVMNLT